MTETNVTPIDGGEKELEVREPKFRDTKRFVNIVSNGARTPQFFNLLANGQTEAAFAVAILDTVGDEENTDALTGWMANLSNLSAAEFDDADPDIIWTFIEQFQQTKNYKSFLEGGKKLMAARLPAQST